ncbi:MAG: TraR/DksA family transcriptional regulator [Frankiales bacterium]|nr:TraR/DksA family transcriptional regulator [Frankiales bacterium]
MDALSEALDDARRRVVDLQAARAEVVAAAEGANSDDEHDPEGATIAYEREQLAALIAQAAESVAAAEAAIAARADGTYGICRACGRQIGAERLEARPSALTCIDCARQGR